MPPPDFARLRVLIVEDEPMIALHIEDTLLDIGCTPVGIASSLREALVLVQETACDLVMLDMNLNGDSSVPVAEFLAERGRPFIFSTGYGVSGIPDTLRNRPVLQKPFVEADLRKALIAALPG